MYVSQPANEKTTLLNPGHKKHAIHHYFYKVHVLYHCTCKTYDLQVQDLNDDYSGYYLPIFLLFVYYSFKDRVLRLILFISIYTL